MVELPDALVVPAALGRAQRALQNQTSPAAATDFTLALDPRYVWRFLSVRATIVTDANVAARELTVQYLDANGNVFDEARGGTTIAASKTVSVVFSAFQPTASGANDSWAIVPLHPVFLEGGLSVRVHVVNVQAADQLSAIRTYAEQFFTDEAR